MTKARSKGKSEGKSKRPTDGGNVSGGRGRSASQAQPPPGICFSYWKRACAETVFRTSTEKHQQPRQTPSQRLRDTDHIREDPKVEDLRVIKKRYIPSSRRVLASGAMHAHSCMMQMVPPRPLLRLRPRPRRKPRSTRQLGQPSGRDDQRSQTTVTKLSHPNMISPRVGILVLRNGLPTQVAARTLLATTI